MNRRYRYAHVVSFGETNVVGNVYFAHYLHWQGRCRERFLAERAPSVLRDVIAGDLALLTLDCSMSYIGQAFACDEIEVSMGLTSLNSSRVEMDFDFRRCGVTIARGAQSVGCMSRTDDSLAPVPVPAELRAALEPYLAG